MFPQFSELTAKVSFTLQYKGEGRAINVKIGDIFFVTNPSYRQSEGIKIARKKGAFSNQGYALTKEQIEQLFVW